MAETICHRLTTWGNLPNVDDHFAWALEEKHERVKVGWALSPSLSPPPKGAVASLDVLLACCPEFWGMGYGSHASGLQTKTIANIGHSVTFRQH